jgi:hypothetical protein
MKDPLDSTRRVGNMTDPKPPFVDNVVAHVRDKIGNRPGFSISTVRSDISTMSKTDPGGLTIVLTESPDDLAIRFIKNEDDT